MKLFIFRLLLLTFTLVSAFITLNFTTSLATGSLGVLIAFAVLGGAFDFLKCSLPSIVLDCIAARRWGFTFVCVFVACLLVTFSLYSSFTMLDTSTQTKIKNDSIYQMTLEQNKRATAEYDRLIAKNFRTVANRDYLPIIERTARELKELQAPQTIGSKIALFINMTLAVLLEFSVVACHIAIRTCSDKNYKRGGKNSASSSSRNELDWGSKTTSSSTRVSTDSTIKSLPVHELAALLITRGDSKMTYKQLEEKYSLSAPKISEIKKYLKSNKPILSAVN